MAGTTNDPPGKGEASEIKKLLEQNLEYSKAIYEMSKKTKRFILFGQIMGVVRILIIVVPIILAIILLPPLIQQWLGPYKELLGGTGQSASILDQLKQLQGSEQLKDLFK